MGLVKSLARPEGNLTGVAFQDTELAGKRLELLHELVAPPVPIAVLNDPKAVGGMRDFSMTEEANRVLGRQLIVAKASNDAEIEAAFVTFARAAAGGLYIGSGAFLNSRRDLIAARAARYRLPAVAPLRSIAESGVLASYGPDRRDAYRRAGVYVSRILKGAKPSDLPIELSRKYELVLNLKTAKSLGFGIPQAVLLRADDVIQ
jgi:putative tryptophan/tyrosine transport system substrate-binding protein